MSRTMLAYLLDPVPTLMSHREQDGEAFWLCTPVGRDLFVAAADEVPRVLADDEAFAAGEGNRAIRAMVGDGSIASIDGETHRARRRVAAPFFGREAAQACALSIHAEVARRARAGARSAQALARAVFLDALSRLVLGDAIAPPARLSFARGVRRYADAAAAPLSQLALLPPVARLLSAPARWLDPRRALRRELARPGAGVGRRGLFAATLEAGVPTPDALDDAVTYLGAGYDTTATGLGWVLHALISQPRCLERLHAEAGSVAPPEVFAWPRLTRFVDETLRLSPVLPHVSRVARADTVVGGHPVRRGERVAASIFLLHRARESFSAPDSFDPDRVPTGTAYVPFGGGPHRCPGRNLALALLSVSVHAILLHASISRARPPRTVWRGTTWAPSVPVVVTPSQR